MMLRSPLIDSDSRQDLLGLTRPQLTTALSPLVDHRYRIDQIYNALYQRGVTELEAMTGLGKSLRARLAEHFKLSPPAVEREHRSQDGTVKILFRLADGAMIETVDIPDDSRRTLCISSQAGCALACRFCVTGYWGGGRNLTAGEIVGQVLAARRRPSSAHGLNLVFMGMGEPLLNLENLQNALEILFDLISWRRITVSTAGVVPGILEMARWSTRPMLAVSLHAPDDERRNEIMPVNRRYPLAELLAALRHYPLAGKKRLTFEYVLIRDFNDRLCDADSLVTLLRPFAAKVNLIPLNPDPVLDPAMVPPDPERVDAFRRRLVERGLFATTRKRRGDDVSAACGQLRSGERSPRGFRISQRPPATDAR